LKSWITEDVLPKPWIEYYDVSERFGLAYNVTTALADLHHFTGRRDSRHLSSSSSSPVAIVHGDLKSNQFVAISAGGSTLDDNHSKHKRHRMPHFKLGDFNLARFVYWNAQTNQACPIKGDGCGGTNRAPEEYKGGKHRVVTSHKIDIYSLGNVLYTILTGHLPFDHDDDHDRIRQRIIRGERPPIGTEFSRSKDQKVQTMLQAIHWCWKHEPTERPTALQVQQLLATALI